MKHFALIFLTLFSFSLAIADESGRGIVLTLRPNGWIPDDRSAFIEPSAKGANTQKILDRSDIPTLGNKGVIPDADYVFARVHRSGAKFYEDKSPKASYVESLKALYVDVYLISATEDSPYKTGEYYRLYVGSPDPIIKNKQIYARLIKPNYDEDRYIWVDIRGKDGQHVHDPVTGLAVRFMIGKPEKLVLRTNVKM